MPCAVAVPNVSVQVLDELADLTGDSLKIAKLDTDKFPEVSSKCVAMRTVHTL
jgi:hypothetical protein